MQGIKVISISSGNPVILMPLSVILAITAIKDFFEDLKRHQSDQDENTRKVLVCKEGEFQKEEWQNLRVGEIIQV